jgi:putative colanic acid biosynthesis acetyltransferase WcaF
MNEANFQLNEFKVPANFRGATLFKIIAWDFINAFVFKNTHKSLYEIRNIILKIFGANIGKNVKIRPSVNIIYPWKLKVGDNSWIGDNVELYCLSEITINNNTCISQYCKLITGSHNYKAKNFEYKCEPIIVGANVWLTIECLVLPGSVIPSNLYIPPRSLLKKNTKYPIVNCG